VLFTFQSEFAAPRWLCHHDRDRQLYVSLDASKEQGMAAVAFHVKSDHVHGDLSKPPPNPAVEPILFLSRLLSAAENNYWPTELEVSCLVWTIRKLRHMIEAAPHDKPAVIYTDHSSTIGIAKATNLSSTA
jgi:hypothetical protein